MSKTPTQKQRLLPRRRGKASASYPNVPQLKLGSLSMGSVISRSAPELHSNTRFYFEGVPLQIVEEISSTVHSIVFKVRSPDPSPAVSPRESTDIEISLSDHDSDYDSSSIDSNSSGVSNSFGGPDDNRLQICEIDVDDTKESPRAILKICTDDGSWRSKKDFYAEEDTLLKIPQHENIVQCYGVVTDNPNILLENANAITNTRVGFLMEYCPNGNLQQYLMKRMLQKEDTLSIIKEMVKPIVHLHNLNIIHRDIRSLNYLISADHKVKLCDFGLCRKNTEFNKSVTLRKFRTNPIWTAPEVYDFDFDSDKLDRQYTFESDIYSLTIVIWEVLNTFFNREYSVPIKGSIYRVMRFCLNGERPDTTDFPPEWIEILKRGWNSNINDRPTISELSAMIDEI
jgi:Protein tyrosine and serine/threonine kinase